MKRFIEPAIIRNPVILDEQPTMDQEWEYYIGWQGYKADGQLKWDTSMPEEYKQEEARILVVHLSQQTLKRLKLQQNQNKYHISPILNKSKSYVDMRPAEERKDDV